MVGTARGEQPMPGRFAETFCVVKPHASQDAKMQGFIESTNVLCQELKDYKVACKRTLKAGGSPKKPSNMYMTGVASRSV